MYRSTYVKEARADAITSRVSHIKTPHLFGWNYFPSFLAPYPGPLRPSLFIMKFTTVFAVLATLATAVSATLSDFNTNAKRLANGMALLPPARRGTATHSM